MSHHAPPLPLRRGPGCTKRAELEILEADRRARLRQLARRALYLPTQRQKGRDRGLDERCALTTESQSIMSCASDSAPLQDSERATRSSGKSSFLSQFADASYRSYRGHIRTQTITTLAFNRPLQTLDPRRIIPTNLK